MKLIIGGAYQGKTAYVEKQFGIDMQHMLRLEEVQNMEDALTMLCENAGNVNCVAQFHLLVRYVLESERDIDAIIDKILMTHPNIIILMDEVGSGIIPLEKAEREYREQVGHAGCILAERACQVIRIVCGIGTVLKDME